MGAMKGAFLSGIGSGKIVTRLFSLATLALLMSCASTVQVNSLAKPSDLTQTVVVRQFRFLNSGDGSNSYGLNGGTCIVEFENSDGYFFRCPGNNVKIPGYINFNKGSYPDNLFPGGVFVAKATVEKPYRVYYYQFNLSSQPTSTNAATQSAVPAASPTGTQVGGAVLAAGIVGAVINRDIGQILLLPSTGEVDMRDFVSKTAPATK